MNNSRHSKTWIRSLSIAVMAGLSVPVVADVEIKPTVSSSLIHVLEASSSDLQFDGHEVVIVSPQIQISRTGSAWQMAFSADHTEQQQLQSGFDDVSYSNFSLNNNFSWWQNRVVFELDASRTNQNIDNTFAGVSDPIFGRAEYIDVDRYNSSLTFQTSGRSNWNNRFRVGISETDFDEASLQDTSTNTTNIIKGIQHSAELQLQYGQRPDQVRGGLVISASTTERENRGDQDTIAGNLLFGFPVYRDIDVVVTANMNKSMIDNTLLLNSDLEDQSYGAGLAWRFGIRSNLEVTYNKDTRGEEEEFVGYKIQMFPNERTSVEYQQSRRFYGESHSMNISHTGNRWDLSVNYGESLNSRTRLNREVLSLGDFLCPQDDVVLEQCNLISQPIDEVEVEEGFTIVEFFEPEFSLDEEVSLTKQGNVSFGYQFRKATLTLGYSKGEAEFIERNASRDTERYSFSLNHRMSRRNALTFSASELTSRGDGENRDYYNVSLSFDRKLTRKANATFTIKKVSNESDTGINRRKDTRAELKYSYQF